MVDVVSEDDVLPDRQREASPDREVFDSGRERE
jgi:hypothetical protein